MSCASSVIVCWSIGQSCDWEGHVQTAYASVCEVKMVSQVGWVKGLRDRLKQWALGLILRPTPEWIRGSLETHRNRYGTKALVLCMYRL
jgi:hypothetical protein